ncbi:hypothetical protein JCM33374_g4450 [Metschnikowia sp. JCM 33374]|nr:hypothetical protein JCM33374_g4450 [Metschnikowia sp. JCM 33374]
MIEALLQQSNTSPRSRSQCQRQSPIPKLGGVYLQMLKYALTGKIHLSFPKLRTRCSKYYTLPAASSEIEICGPGSPIGEIFTGHASVLKITELICHIPCMAKRGNPSLQLYSIWWENMYNNNSKARNM